MQFEERGQPPPDGGQHPGLGAVDLLQDREQPPLLMMVIEDQLGDVHGPSTAARFGSTGMPSGADHNAPRNPAVARRGLTLLRPVALEGGSDLLVPSLSVQLA